MENQNHLNECALAGADSDILTTICLCLEAQITICGIYYFPWDPMAGRTFRADEIEAYATKVEGSDYNGILLMMLILYHQTK